MIEEPYKTVLTNRGYAIIKQKYGFKDINRIKKELTVRPYVNEAYSGKACSFPIYMESRKKIYLPKHYGFETFGKPDTIKSLHDGLDINVHFNGKLRDKQLAPVNTFLQSCDKDSYISKSNGGIISLYCGAGKCHAKNTPIMLYNGSIKMVQDINVGDKLMGDDSTPRTVLSLARGREMMYKVIPEKGPSYIVNKSHILSLKISRTTNFIKQLFKNNIIDISIKDYLELKLSNIKTFVLLGYRVPVIFSEKKIDIDPYILGYWLGNGNPNIPQVKIYNDNILGYFKKYADTLNQKILYNKDSEYHNISNKSNNKFFTMLVKNNLINNKHIPNNYKCNNTNIRLSLLAGIIDSNSYFHNNYYDIIHKNKILIDDIIYLARSLGFAAYKKKCNEVFTYNSKKYKGKYYRTRIHGKGLDLIPVKNMLKKVLFRKQTNNVLLYKISIKKLTIDNYYGFEISGNRRYLLGDFTVTHNTVCGLYLIAKLAKKTLIVVHKEFLINQWIERIKQFLPNARIGTIQGPKVDIHNKDIVLGMLQSISMKEYPWKTFDNFGFTIVDECHHISAEVFSRALPKINTKYSLGLSATPKRKDGLSKVFHWFLGPMIYQMIKREDSPVNVNIVMYTCDDAHSYNKMELTGYGRICMPRMINNITEFNRRLELIIEIIKRLCKKNRKILILSDRRNHLTEIYNKVIEKELCSIGYYVGGMKQDELKESESKDILLGTYNMSSEGMDIPDLDAIIFASPKSDIIQSIGRILRKKHDTPPICWDIVDDFSMFSKQYIKRRAYYRRMKYNINIYEIKDSITTNITNMLNMLNQLPKKDIKRKKKKKSNIEHVFNTYQILNDV